VCTDHPIHPPIDLGKDPWNVEYPESKNYTIKANNGVFELFRDEACTDQVEYNYRKLPEFIQDMQTMCTMIADGPL
jgi:AMP deaminase